MSSRLDEWLDKEERGIEEDFREGRITFAEMQDQLREIYREYEESQ